MGSNVSHKIVTGRTESRQKDDTTYYRQPGFEAVNR